MNNELTVSDRIAIKRLFACYAWALATKHDDALATLFVPEASVEDEQGSRTVPEFLDNLRTGEQVPGRQDWFNQSQVRGNRDRCTVRSFGMTTARFSSGATAIAWLGYYDDVLVRSGETWLFQSRAIHPWSGPVLERFARFEPIPHPEPRA